MACLVPLEWPAINSQGRHWQSLSSLWHSSPYGPHPCGSTYTLLAPSFLGGKGPGALVMHPSLTVVVVASAVRDVKSQGFPPLHLVFFYL